MIALKPWAYGPAELLLDAELRLQKAEDFDRRMALIMFDNAIEITISTYLKLHPIQRGNRSFTKDDLSRWLKDYHTKVEFFFQEASDRQCEILCPQDEVIWFHRVRNDQYHEGSPTIPQSRELQGIRKAAFWIFAVLFNYEFAEVESIVSNLVAEKSSPSPAQRDDRSDRLIDNQYGVVEVAGQLYYTSEVLYAIDPIAYGELASRLDGVFSADEG